MVWMFYQHHPVLVLCDTGANTALVHVNAAHRLGVPIHRTRRVAFQADGKTKLEVCGETVFELARHDSVFKLEALVVGSLDCDVLGGMPFLKENGIKLDVPRNLIILPDGQQISYPPVEVGTISPRAVLRATRKITLFPGDHIDFNVFSDTYRDGELLMEPINLAEPLWPAPTMTRAVAGHVRTCNTTENPIVIGKHQHIAYVHTDSSFGTSPQDISIFSTLSEPVPEIQKNYSAQINVDPDKLLSNDTRSQFHKLNSYYDEVFDPMVGKYNDASGRIRATINIGPVPPTPCKGRVPPQYNRKQLSELQCKMDQLEDCGILAKPEAVGVKEVLVVSPSFLVPKANGDFRIVTNFSNLASFARPPPSRASSTEDVLIFLARWKYMIKSDMSQQFFQLPLSKSSIPYAGVVTPYKGVRVYTRAAMGMPGSTEHLDTLMTRVLGDLMHEGIVTKIADDLYIGADDPSSLYTNWQRVLEIFKNNNLRLSASKTVLAARTTTVLGWIWSGGDISVSPHKVNPLSTAECPKTVKGLRSWIGAYKQLKSCISQYSSLLSDLEHAVGGKESRQKVEWTTELRQAFKVAQAALRDVRSITVPHPKDQLVITSDGSVSKRGVGSVLYIIRNGKTLLGGYFSMKLSMTQARWLPCEIEAAAIAAAVNHWSKFIREAHSPCQLLTDSRPCVLAYKKMARGEYSNSARVQTFLSTLSRYRITLQHVSAANNLPSDYLSRSPMECSEQECQICTFVLNCCPGIVRTTVSEVLEKRVAMPFTNPEAWRLSQQACYDLRQTFWYLQQGTRPSKKARVSADLKLYLRKASLDNNGLLVVKRPVPFMPTQRLAIVPRQMLHGLVTALHIRLQHPTYTQLTKVFDRSFYGLDSVNVIREVSVNCVQCASLRQIPKEMGEFSTGPPAASPGKSFAADVMCRSRQKILVVRDTFSSFTTGEVVVSEKSDTLREALIKCTSQLMSSEGAILRVDCETSFQSLVGDKILENYGLRLELGRTKNKNKNPVAEKAISELERELKKFKPRGETISSVDLAKALRTLNLRIRNRGLSASEIIYQRDLTHGDQISFNDKDLALSQQNIREQNHIPSAQSKTPRGRKATKFHPGVGDLIFIKSDGDKHVAREQYIVIACNEKFLQARKLAASGFRSKIYDLKFSEVYPVPCPRLPTSPFERTGERFNCDPDSSSSDDDPDDGVDSVQSVSDHEHSVSEHSLSDHEQSFNDNEERSLSDGEDQLVGDNMDNSNLEDGLGSDPDYVPHNNVVDLGPAERVQRQPHPIVRLGEWDYS